MAMPLQLYRLLALVLEYVLRQRGKLPLVWDWGKPFFPSLTEAWAEGSPEFV